MLVNLSATGAHQARWPRITYAKQQDSGNIDRAARPAFTHCSYGLKARHNPKVVRICSVDSLVQSKICRARCVCWCMARVSTLRKWKQEDGEAVGQPQLHSQFEDNPVSDKTYYVWMYDVYMFYMQHMFLCIVYICSILNK